MDDGVAWMAVTGERRCRRSEDGRGCTEEPGTGPVALDTLEGSRGMAGRTTSDVKLAGSERTRMEMKQERESHAGRGAAD